MVHKRKFLSSVSEIKRKMSELFFYSLYRYYFIVPKHHFQMSELNSVNWIEVTWKSICPRYMEIQRHYQ